MPAKKDQKYRSGNKPDGSFYNKREEFLGCHEKKFIALFESISTGIVVVSRDGLISCSNSFFSFISGYSDDELKGLNFASIFYGEDSSRVEEILNLSFSGCNPNTHFEVRFNKKDGSRIWADLCISSLWKGPDQKNYCYAFIHDVSAEKRYKEISKIAMRKMDLLGTLAKNEGINRVSAINCYLELAVEKINPECRQYCGVVSSHMESIKKYLEFAARLHDCDLHQPEWQLLSEIFEEVREFDKHIQVEYDTRFEEIEVLSDHALVLVFEKLFENSIRQGQFTTRVNIDFSEDDSGSVFIVWKDNGFGVSPDMKEKIFDKRHGCDSGFDLLLVREVLSFSGAKIEEKGKYGDGAMFWITFPPENCRYVQQAVLNEK